MESFGTPLTISSAANRVDELCASSGPTTNDNIYWCVKAMSSAAHVNSRPIVGGEALHLHAWRTLG